MASTRSAKMVKNHDQEYSRSIEIGEANQRLWPSVKRWCRHIDVEMTSSGMLAQAMGLPIGHLRVVCPHGHSNMEAMQLDWVAGAFIRQNCIGCPHHDEVSPDNYGREVLAATERHESETKAAEDRRKQLKAQAYEAAANSLKSGNPTAGSVNRFILDLFGSDEEARRSKDSLVQAAELGPELFSDAALRVMADAFAGPHAGPCIEAARIICRHRNSVPGQLLTAALQAVEQDSDVACGLLCDAIEYGQNVAPIIAVLPSIVALPGHASFTSPFPVAREGPSCPCTLELLNRLLTTDAGAVQTALAERLKSPEKMVRYYVIELLTDLLPGHAPKVLPLADQVLHSLERPDDIYHGTSADGAACILLAHLYALAPEELETRIQAYLLGADTEVRVLVLGIYSKLALMGVDEERRRWFNHGGFTGLEPKHYARHAPMALDYTLLAIGDLNLSPDQRLHICDDLKRLIECYPAEGLVRIDRILGRLTMTCREARNPPPPAPGPLAAIEAHGLRMAYEALNRSLTEILGELARASPIQVIPSVLGLMDRLDSKGEAEAELKAQLVTTLTTFAETYELVPQVIRQLYKHLMDIESRLVRAEAIRVAGELLSRIRESVPDDLVELLTIFLPDTYVIIHKAAARALRSYRFQRDERGYKVLKILVHIEECYRHESKDFHFLRDVFDTLRSSFRDWPEVERYVAFTLLPGYAGLPNEYFAEDMLVLMGEYIGKFPELASTYVRAALDYLTNTSRHRYQDDYYTDRAKIRRRLSEVPPAILAIEIDRIRTFIRSQAGKDPLDVIRMMEILSGQELHAEAASLAGEALALVPEVKSREFERRAYAAIQAAETAETLVVQGRGRHAVDIIEAAAMAADDFDARRKA